MNKNGQMGIGVIMVMFIAILLGVILFQTIAQDVGSATDSVGATNFSFTSGADEASVDIIGQDLLSTPVVFNATHEMSATADYVIAEAVSTTTGVKTISFQSKEANVSSQTMRVSYTYGPDGYITSSGARSMADLIPIMFALAIAVVALTPTLRSELLARMGK